MLKLGATCSAALLLAEGPILLFWIIAAFLATLCAVLLWASITEKIRKFRARNDVELYLSRTQLEILTRSGFVTGFDLPQTLHDPVEEYRMTVGRATASEVAERFKQRFIDIWREMGAEGTPFDTINLAAPTPDKQLERIDCWMAVKAIEAALSQDQATGFGSDKLSVNVPNHGRVFVTLDQHPKDLQSHGAEPMPG